jgi:hypothetical protein
MFKSSSQQAITQSELHYQQESAFQGKWWRRISHLPTIFVYIVVAVFVANIFLSFVVGHNIPPVDRFAPYTYHRDEDLLFSLSILWTLILHLRLMFKTLSLSTNSITRERQSNNWDMLVLTGIDAREIIRGKWWATVQSMWRNYILLGSLQALLIVWAISKSNFSMFYRFRLNMNPAETPFRLLLLSIIATVFIILISLLNLGLTAACGLLAAGDHRNKSVALIFAIGIRLFTILCITIVPIAVADALRVHFVIETLGGALGHIIVQMLATLTDNGFIVSYFVLSTMPLYVVFNDPLYTQSFYWVYNYFLAMIFSPLIYIALTLLALHFAEKNAIRINAIHPLSRSKPEIV